MRVRCLSVAAVGVAVVEVQNPGVGRAALGRSPLPIIINRFAAYIL